MCYDKFSKPFKTCLGEDAVYNYINSMIEESNLIMQELGKFNLKIKCYTK